MAFVSPASNSAFPQPTTSQRGGFLRPIEGGVTDAGSGLSVGAPLGSNDRDAGALGRSVSGGIPLSGESGVALQVTQTSASVSTEQAPSGLTQAAVARVQNFDSNPAELSEAEEAQVRQLQERDREVRQHEQAHARVGGQYAGAPRYEFVTGPDGRQYAVAGSVSIDVSPIPGDPEATARKAETVRRAALAPAEPSAQDRRVAAEAQALLQEARSEANAQSAAERREAITGDPAENTGAAPSNVAAQAPSFEPQIPAQQGPGTSGGQNFDGEDTGAGPVSSAQTREQGGTDQAFAGSANPAAAAVGQAVASTIGQSVSPSGVSVLNRRILSQVAILNEDRNGFASGGGPGARLNVSV